MQKKESVPTGVVFERSIFRDEMNLIRGRMNQEGFRYFKVEQEKRYETVDREGEPFSILVYKRVMDETSPYELDGWYLFAVKDGKVVGYCGAHIEGYLEEQFITAETSYLVVSQHGRGIGGAMERVNDSMIQRFANENGDLVRTETDANKSMIERRLKEDLVTRELVEELIRSRQLWLGLFGPEGKMGFGKVKDYKLTRLYRKGDCLPDVEMNESNNEVPIGAVVKMIDRWLGEDWRRYGAV